METPVSKLPTLHWNLLEEHLAKGLLSLQESKSREHSLEAGNNLVTYLKKRYLITSYFIGGTGRMLDVMDLVA